MNFGPKGAAIGGVLGAATDLVEHLSKSDDPPGPASDVHGTVKWWNEMKGYGFLKCDTGGEVFVHFSAITGEGFKTLEDGERVIFDVVEGKKGYMAASVRRQR
jgi:CspA family cold shock protein